MIKFSKEKVLLLHKLIAAETGGSVGVRDEGLLESALEGAFASFDGQDLYPSKEEKGARLGYTLISNHAFVDGNKRIGMYIMLTFLEVNGIRLECTNDEIVEVGLSVAAGQMRYEELRDWVLRIEYIKHQLTLHIKVCRVFNICYDSIKQNERQN